MLRPNVPIAAEIESLSHLLSLDPTFIRHAVHAYSNAVEEGDGASITANVAVPSGRMFLLTHVAIESYPLDAAGNADFSQRAEGVINNNATCFFAAGGAPLHPATRYEALTGPVFIPFPSGGFVLNLNIAASGSEPLFYQVAAALSGFLLPEEHFETLEAMATRVLTAS